MFTHVIRTDHVPDVKDSANQVRLPLGERLLKVLWMLMMCAIEFVRGFGIQLFALGNLRYNPRVLVYEPCFLGYKAQTSFRRTAPAPFNNRPCNLAPGKTKVFPLTRIDVRTTGDFSSHEKS
jgi:hypothetical protein